MSALVESRHYADGKPRADSVHALTHPSRKEQCLSLRLSRYGPVPFMGIGELFEVRDPSGIHGREMREANFKRAGGRCTAIESEPERAVFADLQQLVRDRREVPDIAGDRAEHVRGHFGEAAITAAIGSATRLDPVSVPDER